MQPNQQRIIVDLENVQIKPGNWRNFKGEKRQYNPEGSRNFNVELEPALADELKQQGWNVKESHRGELEEGELPGYYLMIKVNFGYKPPSIYVITSGGKTMWGEGLIGQLDELEIVTADLQIISKPHDMNGGGITAYLRKAFIVLYEDRLDMKWAHLGQSVVS